MIGDVIRVTLFLHYHNSIKEHEDKEWEKELKEAVKEYLNIFNQLPQIGIELGTANYDGAKIKELTFEPFERRVYIYFEINYGAPEPH